MSNKTVIPIDSEYAIAFPEEGDVIVENENGELSVLVDIYKITVGSYTSIKQEEITEELRTKIEAFINKVLLDAVERELGDNDVKD